MRNLLLALFLGSTLGVNISSHAGEFEEGSPEVTPPHWMTEDKVQARIQKELEISCEGNLCKLVGQDDAGSSWTVTFGFGYGDNGIQTHGGSTIYIGDNQNDSNKGYAGVNITYKNYKCSSQIRVTPALYRLVNTYAYHMINADGSPKLAFSTAENTINLLFVSLYNKVQSCKGN
ncbi:MAG TPA: protease [Pseudobdellovibrionaceae bacterium]|nr:protease [Pseudobdellovibrionaceae bacterium]